MRGAQVDAAQTLSFNDDKTLSDRDFERPSNAAKPDERTRVTAPPRVLKQADREALLRARPPLGACKIARASPSLQDPSE